MSTPTPTNVKRRWPIIVMGTFGVLLASIVIVILTRNLWLERMIERFASAATQKQVEVSGVSLGSHLEIATITVTDPAHPERPLAQLSGFNAALDLGPGYSPIADEVTVQKAEIHWVTKETLAPATESGAKSAAKGKGGGMDDKLPQVVRIEELLVSTDSPQGAISIGPVSIEARLKPSSQSLVKITGTPRVQASGGQFPAPIDATGDVNIKVERDKKGYTAEIKALLPGLLALDLSGTGGESPGGGGGKIDVRSGTAEGAIWAQVASAALGVPVQFDRVEITPGTLELSANITGVEIKQASVALNSPRLQVGPENGLWLDAPVNAAFVPGRINLAGAGDGSARAQVDLRVGDMKAHLVAVSLIPVQSEISVDPIAPGALAKVFPKLLLALPGLKSVESIGLTSTLSAAVLGINSAKVTTSLKIKDSDTPLTTEANYKRMPKSLVSIQTRYGDANTIEVPALSLDDLSAPIAYTFKADLAAFGGLVGLEGWGGLIDAKGSVKGNGGELQLTATNVVSDSFSLPLDVPMTVTTKFQQKGLGAVLSDFKAEMPDGTAITFATGEATMSILSGATYAAKGLHMALPASFLASQGYLESGTGMVTLKTDQLTMANSGVTSIMEYTLALDTMALPETVAAATKLTGTGHVGLASGQLTAEGTLAAEKVLFAGAALEEVTTALRSEGTMLVLDQIRGKLFGGAVAGTMKIEPLLENYPLTLEARLEGGTLDRFSQEVQPPNVKMGGNVSGDMLVGLRGEEFTALNVDLAAANGLTINRELVAELLMSQQMAESTGSKTVGKVLDKIVGGDEQRPFDAATLKLGLAEGRITGDVTLSSKALNLTVDIKADPAALWEAVKSRGQVSFGDLTTQ